MSIYTAKVTFMELRASLGTYEPLQSCCLAIGVSNALIDYMEFYAISQEELHRFSSVGGYEELKKLVKNCRDGKEEGRFIKPSQSVN